MCLDPNGDYFCETTPQLCHMLLLNESHEVLMNQNVTCFVKCGSKFQKCWLTQWRTKLFSNLSYFPIFDQKTQTTNVSKLAHLVLITIDTKHKTSFFYFGTYHPPHKTKHNVGTYHPPHMHLNKEYLGEKHPFVTKMKHHNLHVPL